MLKKKKYSRWNMWWSLYVAYKPKVFIIWPFTEKVFWSLAGLFRKWDCDLSCGTHDTFLFLYHKSQEDRGPTLKACLCGANVRNSCFFFFCPQEWSTCFMNYKLSTELKPGQISLLPQSSCWLSSHRILNYTISHQNHIHFLNHLKISLSSRKIWLRRSCTTLLGTHQGHAGFPMLIGKRCSSVCTENVFCG